MSKRPLHIFQTREAYLLIAASMFLGLFVSLSLRGLFPDIQDNPVLDNLIVLLGEFAIVIPVLFILKQRKLKLTDVLPFHPVSIVTVIMSIVLVLGVIGLVSMFEVLVIPYFPIPDFLKQLEEGLYEGGVLANIILIIAATLVAPVIEELLFRGILQQSLFYYFGSLIPTLIIPAVVFGLFHIAYLFYLPAMFELISLAILLAWLMIKTGNILIPVLVHAIFNMSAFTGLFIGGIEESHTLADLGMPWIIGSIIFSAVGLIYFKFMKMVVFDDVYQVPLPHEVES